MADRIAELTQRLHEALDVIERRDEVIARLRLDLEAAGRRLSAEAARRRGAEERAAGLEATLAAGPPDLVAELGGRAAAAALVRHAAQDLTGASTIALKVAWRRVPENYRAQAWRVRRRLGRR
jgi:hypothetical protein